MQIHNTMSGRKEEFVPQRPGQAKIYVCGITAYDYCHIGHARSAVVFDTLVRYLRSIGLEVFFVRNFTDVDDKIINRANQSGLDCREVSEKFIQAFHEDMDALGVKRANAEPKATENIAEMIDLIADLIEEGHAYAAASGDVYFRVRSFNRYGQLSGRRLEDMMAGARVSPGEDKNDPLDFALWKAAKPGEPSWPSPWGAGRPGWHIECSAMSAKYLGLPFDIHGGGQDLIFPHHENELAQSEAATDLCMARYWVHNGFVQINSEKMSKSLGNFLTIRDILKQYLPEVVRLFLLTKHYRSPIDFTLEAMEEAEKNLKKVYETIGRLHSELGAEKWKKGPFPAEPGQDFAQLDQGWQDALADDLNTAASLGHVFGLVRLANRLLEDKATRRNEAARDLYAAILDSLGRFGAVSGLFGQRPEDILLELRTIKARRRQIDENKVNELLAQRAQARADKDFARSDALRQDLAALHVEVQDTPGGQLWDVL